MLLLNRELSWLEFNGRVLEEAEDPENPLLERVRFYCIFRSNLDEFFMVRVASLMRTVEEGNNAPDDSGLTPQAQLDQVLYKVSELARKAGQLFQDRLLPEMSAHNIRILSYSKLKPVHRKFLDSYFEREVYPVLTPIAAHDSPPFPWVPGLTFNLGVLLAHEKRELPQRLFALVQITGRLPGLCRLPDRSGVEACWLDEVVRAKISSLFTGYRVLETAGFRLTRDAEVELDEEGRYDYLGMLESGLKKRQRARPIRLEYDPSMSAAMVERIRRGLRVDEKVLLPTQRPLDPRPLLSIVDVPGFDALKYPPRVPVMPALFEQSKNIFEVIRERDVLLHHPYDSFEPVINFIRAAADDPDVLALKQTLYRTSGKDSPVVESLIRAAESGKQVTVLVELTARFDEERNIEWAKDLEAAGAHVLYGISGLKVHAKIALVVRREPDGIRRYVHISTGNYNERTARIYTDMALLTAAEDFGSDASSFFNTITGYSETPTFSRLVMAPAGLRDKILFLIRREAERARSGQYAEILGKMNSLVDPTIIRELSVAGQAGVQIQLNVRGTCCLRPGIPGQTENINIVSIVDRYLEHSRAFTLHNGGDTEVYLSSADWMPRNLDRRIELMFPILQADLQKRVIDVLRAQLADNQKSRILQPDGSYVRARPDGREAIRAQDVLYQHCLEERNRNRSAPPVRFLPIERSRRTSNL